MFRYSLFLIVGSLISFTALAQDELDQYVERLKISRKAGGSETAFLSIGNEFLYGQEHLEAKNYFYAALRFTDVVNKDSLHAFGNYQLAVALILQNDPYKTKQAQPYLERAFRLKPFLRDRFKKDVPQQQTAQGNAPVKSLTGYIDQLKYSRATGGNETAMNTPGNDVMYGYDYYEKGEYRSAATNFYLALAKDPENPYINYLLAVSLEAQGKKAEALPLLNKAFRGDAELKNRYQADLAEATSKHNKYEESRKITTNPPAKQPVGGKLHYGTYACTETVWNGPGALTAYSHPPKGSVTIRANGTYQWLKNGPVGRYSYDPKTGVIKWLSGHFAAAPPKSTIYKPGDKVAQITINFTDDYNWECGCNK